MLIHRTFQATFAIQLAGASLADRDLPYEDARGEYGREGLGGALRYKEFRFENFKGIEKLTLPLDGGVSTLIGLNESGKTTILEAIFCFSYGAEDLEFINPGMASLRDPERWIPISERANFNGAITITAVVVLDLSDRTELRKYMQSTFNLTLSSTPNEVIITEKYNFKNSRHSGVTSHGCPVS